MYIANEARYDKMPYQRCGKSGLKLPVMSVGLWHSFSGYSSFDTAQDIILGSFDLGITHFDVANNYGPPAGMAEEMFGKILTTTLKPYRDELVISTKAGYDMWPGPYGDHGSKKYLTASLDQSLKRMHLDYVDIFYHHRPDPETPLWETMDALAGIVRQGKALYIGLSNYGPKEVKEASQLLRSMGARCLIHQHNYSMLNRANACLNQPLEEEGIGAIAYCPLAQGLLTDKYIHGIPQDSRAAGKSVFLNSNAITEELVEKIKTLNEIAQERGQNLAQMSLAWAVQTGKLTSAILGASKLEQIKDNVKALENMSFTRDELNRIDDVLK